MELRLIFALVFTTLLSTLVLANYISLYLSAIIMCIKSAIPVMYILLYDGRYSPYDGIQFEETASELIQQGYGPISILLNWDFLINYADSIHVTPYWWNLVGQYVFDLGYFSPIFLNILATVGISVVSLFVLSLAGFSESYCKYFLIFSLFHWELLTWSSTVNIKGIFITFLCLLYLYQFLMLMNSQKKSELLYHGSFTLFILVIMYYSRFYMIAILIGSSIAWTLTDISSKRQLLLIIPGVGILAWISLYGLQSISGSRYTDGFYIESIIQSFPRILLTPRPWGIQPEFSFLLVSSVFHWIFVLPAIVIAIRMAYQNEVLRLLFLYGAVFLSFYSIFPELASARMRVQIVFVFAIAQFHFLWLVRQKFEFIGIFKNRSSICASNVR